MKRAILSACMLALFIGGCGNQTVKPDTAASPSSNVQQDLFQLASAGNVTIWGVKEEDMVKEITVRNGELQKSFPWTNVSNESYYPMIRLADLTSDGKEEIVVNLVTGYGTGFYSEELHVLMKDDLEEIPFEDPVDYINKHAQSEITKKDGKVKVTLDIGEESFEKIYDEGFAGSWNEQAGFGQYVRYEILENGLTATVPGFVSPSHSPAALKLTYGSDLNIDRFILEKEH